jgi:phospholipid transport system substrate-binding protein
MITRRSLLSLAAFAVIAIAVPKAAFAEGAATPAQPIAALNAGLLQIMNAGKSTSFAQRMAILTPIVQESFDLPLLLKNSVGPSRWATISEAQKGQLCRQFRLLLG